MTADGAAADELACRELVELVTEYLEDTLPGRLRERFDAHLDVCVGCRNHLQQMRRTIELTGQLREQDIDEAVMRRLMDAFRTWRRPA